MEAKLAALEEEVSILKGEIKAILQEVRTAVLASENPFAGGSTPRPAAVVVSEPEPEGEPRVIQLNPQPRPPNAAPGPDTEPEPQTYSYERRGSEPAQVRPVEAPEAPVSTHQPPDIRALAALLAWVEETRERLDDQRFEIVLGLASYARLVDPPLEQTLRDAGRMVAAPDGSIKPSMNDCIVALRQLEAILAAPGPARRLYEVNDSYEEVRPSRRR
jgi:hypothetical protein